MEAESNVKTVTISGWVRIAYIEAGESQNPLVLFVHGFPDTAYTWKSILPQVASAGYHCVAIFQRGYSPSDIPKDGDYSASRIGMDVLELIAALGHKKAHAIVGHDWGALAVYAAGALDAINTNTNTNNTRDSNIKSDKQEDHERNLLIDRIITIAIPPPLAFHPGISFLWKGRHFLYMASPFAVSGTRANNFQYLDELYHRWSPTWKVPTDELSQIKQDFQKEGRVEAAIGYYKAIANRSKYDNLLSNTLLCAKLLVFGGLDDGIADADSFKNSSLQCADPLACKVKLVPNAGHWVHREQPDTFIAEVIDFLH